MAFKYRQYPIADTVIVPIPVSAHPYFKHAFQGMTSHFFTFLLQITKPKSEERKVKFQNLQPGTDYTIDAVTKSGIKISTKEQVTITTSKIAYHTTKVPQSSTLATRWLPLSKTMSCLCDGVQCTGLQCFFLKNIGMQQCFTSTIMLIPQGYIIERSGTFQIYTNALSFGAFAVFCAKIG